MPKKNERHIQKKASYFKDPEYKKVKADCRERLKNLPEISRVIIVRAAAKSARDFYDRSYFSARRLYFYEEVLGEAVIASRG
jgi:hypothetical protein